MANNGGKGFLLTTKFYKIANNDALLAPDKRKTEGKTTVNLEGTDVKKQENMTTKKLATRIIHANELHTKIGHPREYRMLETEKHLHYIVKGTI